MYILDHKCTGRYLSCLHSADCKSLDYHIHLYLHRSWYRWQVGILMDIHMWLQRALGHTDECTHHYNVSSCFDLE